MMNEMPVHVAPRDGLLDESILMREARRWKTGRRWMLPLLIAAISLFMSLTMAWDMNSGSPSVELDMRLLGQIAGGVALMGAILAYLQSVQVLRGEVWRHTIEGLFLTLQRDRAVILSVVFSGFLAGLIVPAVVLPVLIYASLVMGIPAQNLAAALLVIVGFVFAGASLGTAWFFFGQQLFTVNVAPLRVLVDGLGIMVVIYLVNRSLPLPLESTLPGIQLFWALVLCAAAGLLIWSTRAVFTESAAAMGEAGPDVGLARLAHILGMILPVVAVGALVWISMAQWPRAPFISALRPPEEGLLDYAPPIMAANLLMVSRQVHGATWEFWRDAGPVLAVGLWAFLTLFSMGLTSVSRHFYTALRQAPEQAYGSVRPKRVTIDVGRDDWHGFRNPVLTREMRSRLRSGDARVFIAIAAFLSVLACVIPLFSFIGCDIPATQVASLARDSFTAVAVVQMIIACLIGPGIGAEVITIEREKKTLEMLLATRLTPAEILTGRVLGCLAMMVLLLSPALPLLALASLLHGVTPGMVILMIAILLLFSTGVSVISVCISALAGSPVIGKSIAYLVSAVLLASGLWAPLCVPTGEAWINIDLHSSASVVQSIAPFFEHAPSGIGLVLAGAALVLLVEVGMVCRGILSLWRISATGKWIAGTIICALGAGIGLVLCGASVAGWDGVEFVPPLVTGVVVVILWASAISRLRAG